MLNTLATLNHVQRAESWVQLSPSSALFVISTLISYNPLGNSLLFLYFSWKSSWPFLIAVSFRFCDCFRDCTGPLKPWASDSGPCLGLVLMLSCSVVSNSLWSHCLQAIRLPCPWDSPGKNSVVGCHFLSQGWPRDQTSIFFFFSFIFICWRLITLQYCGFCHALTWVSHGFTCVPHPNSPSCLPLHPIPLGLPSTPALSTCLMHPTWAGDLFHPW